MRVRNLLDGCMMLVEEGQLVLQGDLKAALCLHNYNRADSSVASSPKPHTCILLAATRSCLSMSIHHLTTVL